MLTLLPAFHSVQQQALPRSKLTILFEYVALGDTRKDDVAHTLVPQELVNKLVHVCQGVAACHDDRT